MSAGLGVLDALQGTHRPTTAERFAAAFQAFWRTLALASIALGLALAAASGLTLATSAEVVESKPYAWGFNASFVVSAIAAFVAATRVYTVTDLEFAAGPWRVLAGWSVLRSAIVDASVVQGMYQRTLVLALGNGKEKRLPLLKSMQRALDARDRSESPVAGPPNNELQRTKQAQATELRR